MGFMDNLRRQRDNITPEQLAGLTKTMRRSFWASASIAAAATLASIFMNHSMNNEGYMDLHAKVDDHVVQYMEDHPTLTETQARGELIQEATATEAEIKKFTRWNPVILWGTAGVFFMGTGYAGRRKNGSPKP